VRVDRRSFPFLVDHAVAGTVVLPMVMAAEWFARATWALQPERDQLDLRDLRVLRGVRLDRFDGEGELLSVHAHAGDHDALKLELRGRGGARHYNATVLPTGGRNGHAHRRPSDAPVLGPWTRRETYDGHILFHGPRFQMIRAIEGISEHGMAGELVGLDDLGWGGAEWRTDPVALDGALQLAGLWACHVLGGATLPMALSSYRCYAPGVLGGPLRCIVWAAQVHSARAVCDVALFDGAGRLLAELGGVENVVRPGELVAVGGARAV
jgi:hypothetical protein